jgi:hypothetical protein
VTRSRRQAVGRLSTGVSRTACVSVSIQREAHHNGIAWRKVREQFGDGEIIGIIFALPGQSSSRTLLANLVHGRTYLIICQLEEPEGAPRHNVLGMYRTFIVE